MNELREKIESIKTMVPSNDYGDEMVPITHVISPEVINAVLDAVITALPKERHELVRRDNGYQPDYEAIGSNNTLAYIKSILQHAKENK